MMEIKDIIPVGLTLEERFSRLDIPVSQVVFIWDYYELWLDEYYIRFMSETFVEQGEQKHALGTKEGNYIFSRLTGVKTKSYERYDDRVEITMENDVRIICDITKEQSCFNFHMKISGAMNPVEL